MLEVTNVNFFLAVFFEASKLKEFEESLFFLLNCHKDIAKRVSFHAVLPLSHPPYESLLRLTEKKSFQSCGKGHLIHDKNVNYDLKVVCNFFCFVYHTL